MRSLRRQQFYQPVFHPQCKCQHSEKSKQLLSNILKIILLLFCKDFGTQESLDDILTTADLGQ